MQHVDLLELARQRIRDRAGSIGRVVIDDQDPMRARPHPSELGRRGTDDPLEGGGLVVCGDHNPDQALHECREGSDPARRPASGCKRPPEAPSWEWGTRWTTALPHSVTA